MPWWGACRDMELRRVNVVRGIADESEWWDKQEMFEDIAMGRGENLELF